MENIFLNYIQEYPLEKHRLYQFLKHANQEEFLQSQKPFYYAVQDFSKMLCKLALSINDAQTRLHVIENLWEEHGQGNAKQFHTQTFLNHLISLDMPINEKIVQHPAIQNWIASSLNLNLDASQYAIYLAGIEFIYARISQLICHTLERFDLLQSNHHYAKHEKLDFQHGQELLEVAFECLDQFQEIHVSLENQAIFKQSVKMFVTMFDEICFLTQAEINKMRREKISFYYTREDSSIEVQYAKNKKHILCVCSGGEHIIKIKEHHENAQITALDINPYQLELARLKIDGLAQKIKQNNLQHHGKFEKMFDYITSRLTQEEIKNIAKEDNKSLEKLKLLCTESFSNDVLEKIFTKQATMYSYPHSFIEHFYQVFKKKITEFIYFPHVCNMGNILGKTAAIQYPSSINTNGIDYFCGTFHDYFDKNPQTNFDMIDISNIGDWMSLPQYQGLIDRLYEHLLPNGIIIARKLLGNYDLIEILHSFSTTEVLDNTGFYTQCVIGKK